MFFKKFGSGLRDYLTLTTRERRGMMWLLFVLIAQLSWLFYHKFLSTPEPVDLKALGIEIRELQLPEKEPHYAENYRSGEKFERKEDSLFFFDPNHISQEDLQLLGFSEKQAASILRYRSNGGTFSQKSDFAKCYAVNDYMFARLEPYMIISKTASEKPAERKLSTPQKAVIRIELNAATAEELEQLPMIGIKTAERIIRYREALGGFVSLEQLNEVYGLDSLDTGIFADRLSVDSTRIRYLDLNNDSLRHPYLPWKTVRLLRNYRKQHGDFRNHRDILNVALINEDIYRKIAPYLKPE